MKKIFYQIMGLCSILGVATACNEDPEYFTLDEQPDEMHIVASTDKLVLDKGKEDETAITFTWDAASSPVNETDLVTYSLRLYATANKSATSSFCISKFCNFTLIQIDHMKIISTITVGWIISTSYCNKMICTRSHIKCTFINTGSHTALSQPLS